MKGVLAFLVLALVFAYMVASRGSGAITVVSSVNGKAYRVLPRPDAQLAADALARLENKIRDFLDRADRIAPGDKRLANIRGRWSGTLTEIDGSNNIAYSTSKRDVSICVRDPSGAIDDPDNSMFVLLHEISHIANDDWGHADSFWADFQWILEVAERVGAYRYRGFEDAPQTYCGKTLSSSPLTCVKTGTCTPSFALTSSIKPLRPPGVTESFAAALPHVVPHVVPDLQ